MSMCHYTKHNDDVSIDTKINDQAAISSTICNLGTTSQFSTLANNPFRES